jgi:hypothetical protein
LKSAVADPNLFKSGRLLQLDTLGGISWNGREHKRLFWNDGNGGFTDVAFGVGADPIEDGRSTIFFDADADGDLDLFIANMSDEYPIRMFRNNEGNRRNWLEVMPKGVALNTQAVGAMVKVIAGGKTLVRAIVAGQGYETSYHGPVHFGLGESERADRVEVLFQDGTTVTLKDVASRQLLTICQDGKATCEGPGTVGASTALQTQISRLEK